MPLSGVEETEEDGSIFGLEERDTDRDDGRYKEDLYRPLNGTNINTLRQNISN